jgi:glycerol-3-phosphate dehydrogenase
MFDLLVVGGGVNGCAIARDAAGRGLSVLLVEQGDLAACTSSASTKLIHGGLRYLEHYEFRLVREALAERAVMLETAPHLVSPLTFVLPHEAALRPAWMIRLGLFLYDHLAARGPLPGSRGVSLRGNALGVPLGESFTRGFTYADCWVDDARLVVANALSAQERGAQIRVGTKLVAARRASDRWTARIESASCAEEVEARVVVNAAGPYVSQVLHDLLHVKTHKHLRLVKGSHLVTRKLYEGAHAYILQNTDRRIVFAIPYESDFTLIGSTDVPHDDTPEQVGIEEKEIDYLLAAVSRCFAQPITRGDVVWSYAGLRPLFDDGALEASVVTRDYAFDLDRDGAPALSVFGGKITTARRLAEHALEVLGDALPKAGPAWTKSAPLAGGEGMDGGFDALLARLMREKPFLPPTLARRLAHAYGARVFRLLGEAQSMVDLGADFGCGFTRKELDYLMREEWARRAEDVLWRRSKLGLHMTPAQREAVATAMGA